MDANYRKLNVKKKTHELHGNKTAQTCNRVFLNTVIQLYK